MKVLLKRNVPFMVFVLLITLWIGVFFILPEFIDNPVKGLKSYVILSLHWGIILFASYLLLYLFAINKYVFAFLFPWMAIFGSVLAYFRIAYKATLTPMIVDATIHNDLATTLELISPYLVLYFLLSVSIAVLFVRKRMRMQAPAFGYLHFVFVVVLFSSLFLLNGRLKASLLQRFPFSVYYNVSEYARLRHEINHQRINPEPRLNHSDNDSLTVVFVIGESLRADHLGLNGYARPTTPLLSKRSNLVSFPYIHSEYTNTNRSLPHILTRADSAHVDWAFTECSFISLFKQAGFYTSWISNQDAAGDYVSFINESDTVIFAHPEKSVYNYNNWLDDDLLPPFQALLDRGSSSQLYVLHTIGSHWYYNNHYSKAFEYYRPVTKSRIVAQCEPEEIINSYDNTVVYTDMFLDKVIKRIENRNAVLIYLSDHGEVLGEDGLWLHASDHATLKNPACFVWYSNKFKQKYPSKVNALRVNKQQSYRTDFLYHTLLDGANLPAKTIQPQLSFFSEKTGSN